MNTPSPETADQLLDREITRELRRWKIGTFNYGVTYYVSRTVLIVASATVAAGNNLHGGAGEWILRWVPLLSVLVAILAAFDTWLKPLQKWRGFMTSRDSLADLAISYAQDGDRDTVRRELARLRQSHRDTNIF
ncbi:DUF4231 domain-containing protein [Nocardia bovistercoris]|uniref:DUF4231 domain-containing protein n=1 Tax=Nocardia bovistercoris TaxID=2785916 RepID=A0A931I7Y1_9NOCA|nr:DUF4231 domain-containing protein [Nocardia bovistercoris]MBH0776592.1 DUF4231 domain-containing protein [Nocardia bovistercoris]